MRIAFYCEPLYERERYAFTPASVEGGLGGAESALVFLSAALADLGHQVEVYNAVTEVCSHGPVTYLPAEDFQLDTPRDVAVLHRFFSDRFEGPTGSVRVLWSHDVPSDAGDPIFLQRSLMVVDAVVAVSRFHREALWSFARAAGATLPPHLFWASSCGVNANDYRGPRPPKNAYQAIYCSVPDRGLGTLLDVWPAIRAEVGEVSLVVTGDYSLWGMPPGNESFRARAETDPSVRFLGAVSRSELVRHQLESRLHLHPCAITENFCIASMECQAAATPSVTTSVGAMPTTVADGRSGTVVRCPPTDPAFPTEFAAAAVALFRDQETVARMGTFARRRALRGYSYRAVARRWQHRLSALLHEREGARRGRASR